MTRARGPQVPHGPFLLQRTGRSLPAHRASYGELAPVGHRHLVELLDGAGVRGRGGAGFPLGTKLVSVAGKGRRAPVVVNISEGEPASLKDHVLATSRPHLILDGAELVARALRSRTAHVVVPEERPEVEQSIVRALAERGRSRVSWELHRAIPRFTSGEGSAVVELIEGRQNLPVTTWRPTAIDGIRGRATAMSNAETFAQAAALVSDPERYRSLGTQEEPGTRLLTIDGDGADPAVVEVEHGASWSAVLPREAINRPILLGGYHGTWAPAEALADLHVSNPEMREAGLTIGAGIVLPLAYGECPLDRTVDILRYLASQSAGRCGPCFNGLPALSGAFQELVHGRPTRERVDQLMGLVERRGACAHPDGTVRLVRSALRAFPDELAAHAEGACHESARSSTGSPVGVAV